MHWHKQKTRLPPLPWAGGKANSLPGLPEAPLPHCRLPARPEPGVGPCRSLAGCCLSVCHAWMETEPSDARKPPRLSWAVPRGQSMVSLEGASPPLPAQGEREGGRRPRSLQTAFGRPSKEFRAPVPENPLPFSSNAKAPQLIAWGRSGREVLPPPPPLLQFWPATALPAEVPAGVQALGGLQAGPGEEPAAASRARPAMLRWRGRWDDLAGGGRGLTRTPPPLECPGSPECLQKRTAESFPR